ncbi:MAG: DUF4007 family protein [Methylococcales bacterium]|nr:DUF4007 family protein [Methylococcales bacterium]MCK5925550.1 DUF4007 family protein [Methylococcales bacterium]
MALISNEGEPICRWWIKKGIETIKTDKEIFSSKNMRQARLTFIAGKNRLSTIKNWMLAAQIIKSNKKLKEFELTNFGLALFNNDPKLEKSSSWWAFHLAICFSEINEPYASFFTYLDYLSNDWVNEKKIIQKIIITIKKPDDSDYTEKTTGSSLRGVRRMFADNRPLAELGLIQTRKNSEEGIAIRLGTPKLTDEIIIHGLAMMRFHSFKSRSSIDFSELLADGLAHYLCLSPEKLRTHLRRMSQSVRWKNYFGFNEAVNIDSISFNDDCNPKKTLLELLQKGEDTWL